MLDINGICATSGSACMAGNAQPSYVLLAMGKGKELAKSALRVSFGKENTKQDVEKAVDNIERIVNDLRKNKL